MIVKASDTDYGYSGNLYFEVNKVIGGDAIYRVSSGGCNKVLEYSLNQNKYTDFEYFSDYGGYSNKTEWIGLGDKNSTITIRDKNTKVIYSRAVIINDKNYPLAIVKTVVGHSDNSKGSKIALGFSEMDVPIEYSIDNGKNFYPVIIDYKWTNSSSMQSDELFSDRVIIRNKNTKEIIYESPKIGEIEEKHIYENGKTKVTFTVNGDAKDATSYTYTINGEKHSGNSFTVESDSTIKLEAYTNKEFVEQTAQKEIQVKVINVEKPSIELDKENNLVLNSGTATNDELGNIYYSINDGEYTLYTEKIKLQPGTHTINAYQETKEYKVKSLIETKEVTIEEKIENNDQENKDDENNEGNDNKEENNNGGDINKEEYNEQASNEKTDKEEINNENTNNKQKVEDKNFPKTGDAVFAYIIAIFVIIILNIVIKQKRKK